MIDESLSPPPSSLMPKIVDHDKRREELALSSYRLLCERGYDGATMRQLAQAAGVSTGTLYHYFPDKASILTHVFDVIIARNESALEAAVNSDGDLQVRTSQLVHYVLKNADSLTSLIRLSLEMVRHEPSDNTTRVLHNAAGAYRKAIGDAIGMPVGPFVDAFFSYLMGTLIYQLIDPDEDPFALMEVLTNEFGPLAAQIFAPPAD